jgi:putative transposase
MEPLQLGKYYHIYNRGNNREDLFRVPDNYQHFLRLYEKYIHPIADTFAWVLMKNHFHLLVRIKEEEEIDYLPPIPMDASRSSDPRSGTDDPGSLPDKTFRGPQDMEASDVIKKPTETSSNVLKKPVPSHQFAHLFNAYTKYYNKKYGRTGSLFEKSFRRIEVSSDRYFRQLVVYIHNNPVHHGFTPDFKDYPWSSYGSILSVKFTKLSREKVIGWFDDKANFVAVHNRATDMELIKEFVIE